MNITYIHHEQNRDETRVEMYLLHYCLPSEERNKEKENKKADKRNEQYDFIPLLYRSSFGMIFKCLLT
jgi:hypothetical protein